MRNSLYPVFLDLHAKPVLVVGGGGVAARKTEALLAAGAEVRVAAPRLTPSLAERVRAGRVRRIGPVFAPEMLQGVWLVIAATGAPRRNREIADAARARRIFVNAVDDAAHCDFHVPAVVRRGPLQVAVSSAGQAPLLAQRIRGFLEGVLDESLGALIGLAGEFRAAIRRRYPDPAARRRFYAQLWDGPVRSLLRRQRNEAARQWLATALERGEDPPAARGHVVLVGAGPGDPGLLTLRGLRHLQDADVILYDRLVGEGVLALARRDAERIDVGKRVGDPRFRQADIHALMRRHVQAGRRVVRLKGGDPLVFGRGGEELEYLRAHGIDYEVVPGVTAALACAAYAGIPLTHRDYAHAVLLASGHCANASPGRPVPLHDGQTLAVYMGVGRIQLLQTRLLEDGSDPATPFALVENGTLATQRVVTGRLERLAELAETYQVQAPAVLVLGNVAAFASSLHWYGEWSLVPGESKVPALAIG